MRKKSPTEAFTLVEVLVAMSTFLIMLGFMGSILNSVYRGWDTARRETEIAQNARAILSLIERDAAPAIVSNLMQFAVNPDISTKLQGESQVSGSDAIFFYGSTAGTGTSEIGWYLTEPSPNVPGKRYDLKRFRRTSPIGQAPANTATSIYWLQTSPQSPLYLAPDSRVVSERVLGFWVECLDRNGRNVPVLSVADPAATPLRYNSAARFQMAPRGQQFDDGTTFHYTGSSTVQAHSLPGAVRITLLVTDEASLLRKAGEITPPPVGTTAGLNVPPPPVEQEVFAYKASLHGRGVHADSYITTIQLSNAQNL